MTDTAPIAEQLGFDPARMDAAILELERWGVPAEEAKKYYQRIAEWIQKSDVVPTGRTETAMADDEYRAGDLTEAIERCTAVLSNLEDLGVDSEDMKVPGALRLADAAIGCVENLRRAFEDAKGTVTADEPRGDAR